MVKYYSACPPPSILRQYLRTEVLEPLATNAQRCIFSVLDSRRVCSLRITRMQRQKGTRSVKSNSFLVHTPEPVVLVTGHDFVSYPRLSPDGRQLAYTTWEHPNMPWDATQLWLSDVTEAG